MSQFFYNTPERITPTPTPTPEIITERITPTPTPERITPTPTPTPTPEIITPTPADIPPEKRMILRLSYIQGRNFEEPLENIMMADPRIFTEGEDNFFEDK